jgi:hypothetical protein
MIIAWDKVTDTAVIPERFPNDGEWARFTEDGRVTKKTYFTPPTPVSMKNVYTGPQFWKALENSEQVLMINKARATDNAGAIFESIKLNGLDFNDADDMAIGDQMVNAGILTQTRLDALAG